MGRQSSFNSNEVEEVKTDFEKARYSFFCGDPIMYNLLYVICLDWRTVEVFFKQLFAGEYSAKILRAGNQGLGIHLDQERRFMGP